MSTSRRGPEQCTTGNNKINNNNSSLIVDNLHYVLRYTPHVLLVQVVLFVKSGLDADIMYGSDYCEASPIAIAVELDYLDIFRKLAFVSRVIIGEKRREILAKFLEIASEVGSKGIVEELLQIATDENFTETDMFQDAVDHGCVIALRRGHHAISDLLTRKVVRGRKLNEALKEAVKSGVTDIVQRLIVKGADVNDAGGALYSLPLMLAVKYEQLEVLPVLFMNSTSIPEEFWTELAAANNEFAQKALEVYKNLRLNGANLDPIVFTNKKINALHVAAANDREETLYQFVDLGAKHDLVDEFGNSILHWAASNDGTAVLKNFSDHFSPGVKNKDGDTALHIACKNARPKACQILLQAIGVDLKIRNAAGDTCLHSAVRKLFEAKQFRVVGSPVKSKINGNIKIIISVPTREDKLDTVNIVARAFLAAGLLNEKDANGNTALSILVQAGREKEVQFLAGSSPTAPNKEGKCALDYAMLVYPTKPQLVGALLDTFGTSAAVYLATRYREGKMPLHVFAEYGEVDKVQLLTQHGASVTDFNEDGNTIMHLLAELAVTDSKNSDTYLKMAQVIVEALINYRIRRQMHMYEYLRNQMPEVFSKVDEYCRQPIIAQHIADEDLEILIMVYLTRKMKNRDGLTVINYAASIRSQQFLVYLLDVKKIEKNPEHNGDVRRDSNADNQIMPLTVREGDDDEEESSNSNFMMDEMKMAIYNVNYLSPESLQGLAVIDCDWLQEAIQETFIELLYPILGKSLSCKSDAANDKLAEFKQEAKAWAIMERFDSLRENEERRASTPRRAQSWKADKSSGSPNEVLPLKKKKSNKQINKETPKTDVRNNNKRKSSLVSPGRTSQVSDSGTIELSLLETVIEMKDEVAAAEIIDIMPLTKLVECYWAAYRWIYFLIMLVHIAYMSAFSAYTISDEGNPRCENATNGETEGYSIIHPYLIFLFYPFVFLGVTVYFETVQFVATYRRRRSRGLRVI